jgi:hypothetical protein
MILTKHFLILKQTYLNEVLSIVVQCCGIVVEQVKHAQLKINQLIEYFTNMLCMASVIK